MGPCPEDNPRWSLTGYLKKHLSRSYSGLSGRLLLIVFLSEPSVREYTSNIREELNELCRLLYLLFFKFFDLFYTIAVFPSSIIEMFLWTAFFLFFVFLFAVIYDVRKGNIPEFFPILQEEEVDSDIPQVG
jgi:hypothetical protein